jgi:STE24 endopeptidase
VLQLWVISLVAAVYMHDELVQGAHRHVEAGVLSGGTIATALVPYLLIAAAAHGVCRASGRAMDRRGSLRAVAHAERALAASRLAAALTHVLAVFTLGWVEQVRAMVGDLVMVDELLAITPALLTIAAGWWSFYPIEQRLRNAVWIRVLEDGHPAYPTPSRWQFVWSNVRHQMLFVLVPIAMIGAWTESWDWLLRHRPTEGVAGQAARWMVRTPGGEAVRYGVHFLGVALVFVFAPLLMRLVWDAVPLGAGPLRDRLMRVCERAGVRVRELLVWRTHGTMLNGAAMGLIAPLRYILLTDALLDHLPARQVESVMAHEVGHAKHHHIPWLVMGMVATLTIAGAIVAGSSLAVSLACALLSSAVPSFEVIAGRVMEFGGLPFTVVASIVAFGWISRRFEWQADAFAAKQLSRDEPASEVVTAEAAEAMCDALGTVCRLNHIEPGRASFRHGSISLRQNKLHRLVGTPLGRVPIDRTVRWIKGGIVVGMALMVGAMAIVGIADETARARSRREPIPWPESLRPSRSTLEEVP